MKAAVQRIYLCIKVLDIFEINESVQYYDVRLVIDSICYSS